MGVLAKDNRQLIFIYSEDSRLAELVLPYVKSIDKPIRLININKEGLSDTIWIEIAALLQMKLEDLFCLKKSSLTQLDNKSDYSSGDWLKIINNTPSLLQNPIAINGNKAVIIEDKHNIFSFYNTALANSDKTQPTLKLANDKDVTKIKV